MYRVFCSFFDMFSSVYVGMAVVLVMFAGGSLLIKVGAVLDGFIGRVIASFGFSIGILSSLIFSTGLMILLSQFFGW